MAKGRVKDIGGILMVEGWQDNVDGGIIEGGGTSEKSWLDMSGRGRQLRNVKG